MEEIASSSRALKLKTYIVLFLMITVGSVGNTILDKGMKSLGPIDFSTRATIWQGAFHTFTNGTIWLGIGMLLLFFAGYLVVLGPGPSVDPAERQHQGSAGGDERLPAAFEGAADRLRGGHV